MIASEALKLKEEAWLQKIETHGGSHLDGDNILKLFGNQSISTFISALSDLERSFCRCSHFENPVPLPWFPASRFQTHLTFLKLKNLQIVFSPRVSKSFMTRLRGVWLMTAITTLSLSFCHYNFLDTMKGFPRHEGLAMVEITFKLPVSNHKSVVNDTPSYEWPSV
jgi:hypothetical protein